MPPSAASRSSKDPSTAGLITFIGLRALSPLVQYGILAQGAGDALIAVSGGTVLVSSIPVSAGLPLSIDRAAILGMSAIAALKHIIYATSLTQSRTDISWALEQSAYNGISDAISSLLYICAQTSPSANKPFPQSTFIAGLALFGLGIGLELTAEAQRYFFKKDPSNEGKLHQTGLFGLSRHVNYLGFTIWRTGMTFASAGWVLGSVSAIWASISFLSTSIPELEKYLAQKYGKQFEEYKAKVPYAYIPFVY